MATHSSTLAWIIPWMEEPGRLQSMGSLSRTRLSSVTFTFHFPLSCTGEGNGNPLQCSCLENPRDRGAWWAAVYGVTQSRTRLKQLSNSSSSKNPLWGKLSVLTVNTYHINKITTSFPLPFVLRSQKDLLGLVCVKTPTRIPAFSTHRQNPACFTLLPHPYMQHVSSFSLELDLRNESQ